MDFKVLLYVFLKENINYILCKFCSKVDSNNVRIFNCFYVFCEVCFKKFFVENFVICL